ncbi:CD1247 N-terminal domain-containing protein [Proteinivorax hydrogeniformans]|uniref:CD1247 N-terminal domain-containing protein n=1 Tax=Proteinivorax hydrogeniformans TaxID=1826727 RepID=A0AAU8HQV4_9FIRM
MSDLREKIAYIKGLAEGMKLDQSSNEGKILDRILDVLGDMSEDIEDLYIGQDEIEEYVEAVDHDLAELEADFIGADDIYEDEIIDEYGDGDIDEVAEYELTDEDIEVECPSCGEAFHVDEEELADEELEILCPGCEDVVFATAHEEEVEV